jgi:hypothetical protein
MYFSRIFWSFIRKSPRMTFHILHFLDFKRWWMSQNTSSLTQLNIIDMNILIWWFVIHFMGAILCHFNNSVQMWTTLGMPENCSELLILFRLGAPGRTIRWFFSCEYDMSQYITRFRTIVWMPFKRGETSANIPIRIKDCCYCSDMRLHWPSKYFSWRRSRIPLQQIQICRALHSANFGGPFEITSRFEREQHHWFRVTIESDKGKSECESFQIHLNTNDFRLKCFSHL